MRKIIFWVFLLNIAVLSQTFDLPIDSTRHYNLRHYYQSDRVPYYILNEDKSIIDSVMYSLIVWVDTLSLVTVQDTNIVHGDTVDGVKDRDPYVLRFSPYMSGMSAFSTTDTSKIICPYDSTIVKANADTVQWMDSSDVVIVTPREAFAAGINTLSVTVSHHYFTVKRASGGTSGLKFNWVWISRYNQW